MGHLDATCKHLQRGLVATAAALALAACASEATKQAAALKRQADGFCEQRGSTAVVTRVDKSEQTLGQSTSSPWLNVARVDPANATLQFSCVAKAGDPSPPAAVISQNDAQNVLQVLSAAGFRRAEFVFSAARYSQFVYVPGREAPITTITDTITVARKNGPSRTYQSGSQGSGWLTAFTKDLHAGLFGPAH